MFIICADSFADFVQQCRTVVFTAVKPLPEILKAPVSSLDICMRTQNCLTAEGIYYIGQLIQWTEKELLGTPNLGKKSFAELKAAVVHLGLDFGTKIDGIPSMSKSNKTLWNELISMREQA